MTQSTKIPLFILRITLGWVFLYAGISHLTQRGWSAAGYLQGAKTLSGFYAWFAQPGILPVVNVVNEWALVLLGVSLLLGIFVRLSASLGVVLMLLYYIPVLDFPLVGDHSYLVDEHIIYAAALAVLAAMRAGRVWGLEPWCARLPFCAKSPRLREWLG